MQTNLCWSKLSLVLIFFYTNRQDRPSFLHEIFHTSHYKLCYTKTKASCCCINIRKWRAWKWKGCTGGCTLRLNGPTVWLFRGGMGDFRKKYPADWFRGKNNSCKEIPGGKSFRTEEKYFSWLVMLGKKSYIVKLLTSGKKLYHQRLGEKESYPNQITYPPVKVKCSAPD